MACRIPPLKKAKNHGEMPLPSLDPIPLKNVESRAATGRSDEKRNKSKRIGLGGTRLIK